MKTYLFRLGDGNEGNYPRHAINIAPTQCPYRALEALVLNQYKLGPLRDYIAAEIETDGEPEHGIITTVYEGPEGEQAFGAAWITAELEPADLDPEAQTLADVLDAEALAYADPNHGFNLEAMHSGYLECALWSSTDESGASLDEIASFAPEAEAGALEDCQDFVRQCTGAGIRITQDPAQVGHDLWLTRNRHGAGFWDRGLGTIGERLTQIAHCMGSRDAYVGDDGQVYFQ